MLEKFSIHLEETEHTPNPQPTYEDFHTHLRRIASSQFSPHRESLKWIYRPTKYAFVDKFSAYKKR